MSAGIRVALQTLREEGKRLQAAKKDVLAALGETLRAGESSWLGIWQPATVISPYIHDKCP